MPMATSKSKITKDFKTINITIVGLPKVGKSTFASHLGNDDVYFASTEPGHAFLEIFKTDVRKWSDFAELVKEIATTKHKFKHLVIDVMDNLVDYAELEVCSRNRVKAISDMPYGSGYTAVKRMIMGEVAKINNAKIGITFVTHAKEKEVKSDSISWTAMATSLSGYVEKQVLGVSDLILYCYMSKDGSRKMRTKPTKNVVCAGDRSGKLPEIMNMNAKELIKALAGETKE